MAKGTSCIIRMEPELLAAIDELAGEAGASRNAYVVELLRREAAAGGKHLRAITEREEAIKRVAVEMRAEVLRAIRKAVT